MYNDYENEDGESFSLHFNGKYGNTQTNVNRNFKAEDLTSVLNEMVQFLQSAGYNYVEGLEAYCRNDISHSSNL